MSIRQTHVAGAFAVLSLSLLLVPDAGCSSKSSGDDNASDDGGGGGGGDDGGCTGFSCSGDDGSSVQVQQCAAGSNLQCQQVSCPNKGTTSLKGVIYDPAGKHPLYNVSVYVPNSPPVMLPDGASCASCSTWYTDPLVTALTDPGGNFEIDDMPVGKNIPLIVQVGKWRHIYTLSNVQQCVSNDAASLAGGMLRMPKNHMEGDIPNIAVSTGQADSLECLLFRMGIDKSEYTGDPMGAGRIHIFTGGNSPAGNGGAATNAPVSKQSYQYLWNRDASMTPYDVVLLSCEGNETSFLNDAGRLVLSDYANNGGRVFASHYHYSWFTPSGPFSTLTPPLATWQTATVGYVGTPTSAYNADIVTTLPNGMPFPEGVAMKQWLQNVGALTNGLLPIYYSRHNADVTAANTHSQSWVSLDPSTPAPNATQYFSFDTPVGLNASEQCGRIVYSDLHVSGGAGSEADPTVQPDYPGFSSGGIVPDGCASHDLTAQEKALEFMIFDLSSCLTPVGVTPVPITPK